MSKRPGAYHRPTQLGEALQLLEQPNTVPLAGGTKLLSREMTSVVVDLQALGLNKIELREHVLQVGAAITLVDLDKALSQDQLAQSPADLLRGAIRLSGPNTYRNAATLGGSIASRLVDSELLATLLVLDASLTIYTPSVKNLSLNEFLAAEDVPRGLITEIAIPWSRGFGDSQRVARTPADDPIVSITLWKPVDHGSRLAATGIAVRPLRLREAEKQLAAGLFEASIEAAAAASKADATHPGDFRGDADYRGDMAAVLVRRVCETARLNGA